MPLWDQIFRGRTAEERSVPFGVRWLDAVKDAQTGGWSTEQRALTLTAVYRSVSLIAGTGAGLPLKVYRNLSGGRREEIAHGLISRPNPYMTGFVMMERIISALALWGNAYALKVRDDDGNVIALIPYLPNSVTPKIENGRKLFEILTGDGGTRTTDQSEILHIPGWGYDGIQGISPIQATRAMIDEQITAREYAEGVFDSGAVVSGLLTTPMRLKKEQADALKERWRDSLGGRNRAGDIGILDQGFQFQPISINPSDLQLLETRKWGVAEVARAFGVPPHLLSDVEKSTSWGTGIEEQTRGFLTYTLQPGYLARIEAAYSDPAEEILPEGAIAEFKIEGLLRSRSVDRALFYERALGGQANSTGWMTREEVRRLENLE